MVISVFAFFFFNFYTLQQRNFVEVSVTKKNPKKIPVQLKTINYTFANLGIEFK